MFSSKLVTEAYNGLKKHILRQYSLKGQRSGDTFRKDTSALYWIRLRTGEPRVSRGAAEQKNKGINGFDPTRLGSSSQEEGAKILLVDWSTRKEWRDIPGGIFASLTKKSTTPRCARDARRGNILHSRVEA